MERRNNYEMTKDRTREVFLTYDQDKMIERFGLSADGHLMEFMFMGTRCRVNRDTGTVKCADELTDEFREADFNEAMTVYDLLCGSSENACPAGEFVPMSSLYAMHSASSAFGESQAFRRQNQAFDRDPDGLKKAMESLGGTLTAGGDVCGVIPVFADLRVMTRFWRSDEDFPAQLQFLWDRNVLSYLHYETVWYANGAIADRLMKIACSGR